MHPYYVYALFIHLINIGPVKTCVPVHLRLVSSRFEALRSLQSKFSSQNSANHTFLRLFSSVSPVKYSSKPGDRGKRRMAQFRTNYQPGGNEAELVQQCDGGSVAPAAR